MTYPNAVLVKLASITREVVNDPDSKFTLNEKIAKAVKKHNLNSNEVDRVVEWSNTLKQLKEYKKGDKTREFDIADRKKVMAAIYGANKPVAYSDPGIDPYVQPAKTYLETNIKSASVNLSDYDMNPAELVKSAMAKINRAEKLEEQGLVESYINLDKCRSTLLKIANNLAHPNSESFEDFEISARKQFGEKAVDFLNIIEKQSSANCKRFVGDINSIQFYDDTFENLNLLKEAIVQHECALANRFMSKKAELVKKSWDERLRSSLARS